LAIVLFANIGAPYSEWVLHSTMLCGFTYYPMGLMYPFILVSLLVNVALRSIRREWGLGSSELLIAYLIGLFGASAPTYGMAGFLLAVIASPFYFASPENGWDTYFHQHVPSWICPHDSDSIRWFFEGLPPGESVPWSVWVVPLFWWLTFLAAVVFIILSACVVLRRQWVENERLAFPLLEVPMLIVADPERGGRVPPLLRSKLFWMGFLFPVFWIGWNAIGYWYPLLPRLKSGITIHLGGSFRPIRTYFAFVTVALIFFIRLDVSLSIWCFFFVFLIEDAVLTRIGFTSPPSNSFDTGGSCMAWQSMGAFIAMAAYAIWIARGHLRLVLERALRREGRGPDHGELIPYPTCVWGSAIATLYILFWLHASGVSWLAALLLLFAAGVIFLGLTRIVAESGMFSLIAPLAPATFPMHVLGTARLTGASMTGLAFSYAWVSDCNSAFMPFASTGVTLTSRGRLTRRSAIFAVAAGLLVAIAVTIVYSLHLGYLHGAFNFQRYIFSAANRYPFATIVKHLRNPDDVSWKRLAFLAAGGAVMTGLYVMRARLAWWPLSPIGFPICASRRTSDYLLPVFLAWLIKLILLRFGGNRVYQRAKPLFVGMVVGFFFAQGTSFLIDVLFFRGAGGHYV